MWHALAPTFRWLFFLSFFWTSTSVFLLTTSVAWSLTWFITRSFVNLYEGWDRLLTCSCNHILQIWKAVRQSGKMRCAVLICLWQLPGNHTQDRRTVLHQNERVCVGSTCLSSCMCNHTHHNPTAALRYVSFRDILWPISLLPCIHICCTDKVCSRAVRGCS